MALKPGLQGMTLAAALAGLAAAPPSAPAPSTSASDRAAPPAPAIKAGDRVVDASGAAIGTVSTLTESSTGPIVVVAIDGKQVGLPQSTLRRDGQRVISSQTKTQILAQAGAPR